MDIDHVRKTQMEHNVLDYTKSTHSNFNTYQQILNIQVLNKTLKIAQTKHFYARDATQEDCKAQKGCLEISYSKQGNIYASVVLFVKK